MAVVPVRLFGDPVLRTPADPVASFDDRLARLVDDLLDTMDHENGAGLAAPQIGVTSRVFVYDCDGRRGHVVNPSWEPVGDATVTESEGCLSIPGVRASTRRFERVRLTGVDRTGAPVDLEAKGLFARAVQHETDHLDGVLFPQRLGAEERKAAMRTIRASEWFGSAAISGRVVYADLADALAGV